MTTLVPREPYTKEELEKLYPKDLQLQLVQVILRHGERSPVSARFRNAGLTPFWPYCSAAKRMTSAVLSDDPDSEWDQLKWRRRLETFGEDDDPAIAAGPKGKMDAIWQDPPTHRLRTPNDIEAWPPLAAPVHRAIGFYARQNRRCRRDIPTCNPLPRALESLQQSFWGMYPRSAWLPGFPEPTIITRRLADETLGPNYDTCTRFIQLTKAYSQRAADRWDNTKEMDYLNDLISKWMPPCSPRVAVGSHPSAAGILDTINATRAHGAATRLPKEFYDEKGLEILDRISTDEWFTGYKESSEFRALGIGSLLGDMVSRMVGSVEGERKLKFALSGAHDTTIAGILASLGAFEGEHGKWPTYTSHIAMELFRKSNSTDQESALRAEIGSKHSTLWHSLFRPFGAPKTHNYAGIARNPQQGLSVSQKKALTGYYVRMRYNDHAVVIEGCRVPGNHLEGDESFCTLEAFKAIVDKFTPINWKQACSANLGKSAIPSVPERPGI
ncbi:MAG: hypothetical protein M1839_004239 [Geoglossum umbratile]|nr:MAG: hypothetical protein M1839_004239 [Geoglossum umbratile]